MGVPHKSNFLFLQWANLIGPSQKKIETMDAPQNRRFYWKTKCLPLWPTYIGEKGRTLGKTYWIKARYHCEHPWEHIGNLKGTKEKWKKSPTSTKTEKEENQGTLSACWPFHWLHEISISKTVGHDFWLELIAPL